MTAIIERKNVKKEPLSAAQKTFDRLRKKVQTLQNKLQTQDEALNRCLEYYHTHLKAAEELRTDETQMQPN